ncbi:MAG: BrnA antitoxin family protein [Pyrinomonadaceae bacterium]
MSNKDKDYEDYPDEVYASEAEFLKHFRVLEGDELSQHKLRIAKAIGSQKKSRVTIYFDNRIINRFKEIAKERDVGYQTLINETLLSVLDYETSSENEKDLKEEILKDKKFLKLLKTALST